MSVDGTWTVTVNSPMGPQPSSLTLQGEGGPRAGTQSAKANAQPIVNGKVDGDPVTWSNSITTPFPMTLEFTGKVDGDTLNGSVKAGSFGNFPFTGTRA